MIHCLQDAAPTPSYRERAVRGAAPDAAFDLDGAHLDAAMPCNHIRLDGHVAIVEAFDAQ